MWQKDDTALGIEHQCVVNSIQQMEPPSANRTCSAVAIAFGFDVDIVVTLMEQVCFHCRPFQNRVHKLRQSGSSHFCY